MEQVAETLARIKQLITPANGELPKRAESVYRCRECFDLGWLTRDVAIDHPDFSRPYRCSCQAEHDRAEMRERLLKLCALPPRAAECTFKTYELRKPRDADAQKAAIAVAKGKLKWLTMAGPVGSGKSHLALAICQKWLEQQLPARFIYVPELLDRLRRGYDTGEYESDLDFFRRVDLLVLDDLGAERDTDWATEKLEIIINHRYEWRLPLVATTNLPPSQLKSARITSRLLRVVDEGIGQVVALG